MSTKIASLYAEISADTTKLKSGLKDAKGELQKAKQENKSFFDDAKKGWGAVAAGIASATAAIYTAKKAYDFAKEGASIELINQKFNRLAVGIGTTGDVLKKDLLATTKGLVSDFDLLSSTVDFLSLGLARNQDEAVRLARVSSELGFNMNQLVLTLTNMTTMRFDALGLQVVGFDEKVKALEETGLSAADAFKEAFLQQAEEQLTRVGSVAGTAAGQFQAFEANMKNVADQIKVDLLDAFEGTLTAINKIISDNKKAETSFDGIISRLDKSKLSYKDYNEKVIEAAVTTGRLSERQAELILSGRAQGVEMQNIVTKLGLMTEREYLETKARENSNTMWGLYAEYLKKADAAMLEVIPTEEELAAEAAKVAQNVDAAASAYNNLASASQQDFTTNFGDILGTQKFAETGGDVIPRVQEQLELVTGYLHDNGMEGSAAWEDIKKQTELATVAAAKYTVEMGEATRREAGAKLAEELDIGLGEALQKLDDIQSGVETLNGIEAYMTVYVTYVSSGIIPGAGQGGALPAEKLDKYKDTEKFASGGFLGSSKIAKVGEEGYEYIIDGYVFTHAESQRLDKLIRGNARGYLIGGELEGDYIHPLTGATIHPQLPGGGTMTTKTTSAPPAPSAENIAVTEVQKVADQMDLAVGSQALAIQSISNKTANSFQQSTNQITSLLEDLLAKMPSIEDHIRAQQVGARSAGL